MDLRRFEQSWFAIQVRPRGEEMAAMILSGKGYEPYLPLQRFLGRRSRVRNSNVMPLFPGYLFCRFSASAHAPIVTTPGVIRIVGYGKTPVAIKDEEIASIRAIERSDKFVHCFPNLKIGDRIRIGQGPLAGVEGLLVNVKSGYRLIVSLDILCRSIAVDIDAEWIDGIRPRSVSSSPKFDGKLLGNVA
jgi:transcriptional antiterminator NusG